MACSATPTTTLYTSIASTSISHTFSASVTTLPPVVTTFTTESCSATGTDPHDTGCVTIEVAVVSTVFAGGPSTIQVPLAVVYEFTQVSPTATLFASCSSQELPSDAPSSASSTTSSTASTATTTTIQQSGPSSVSGPSTSTPFYTSLITPAPSVIVTTQTTTQSDGSVVYVLTTYTSTLAPVSALFPSSSVAGGLNSHHSTSSSFIAPVVGGILGGFFGLIAIVVFIWWLWRRRSCISRPPTPDLPSMAYRDGSNPMRPEDSTEPKPYHYGGLGSRNSRGSSRPNSPQARSSTYSQNNPPTTPHSMNRSSTGLSFNQSGAPTPTFFATTAIAPGQSQPNSRSSTPGHFHSSSTVPSAYMRQSWPLYASDGDESDSASSPIMFGKRERRPSRLSLTLSMMDGTRESCDGGAGPSGQSTAGSVKSGDMSTEIHVPERSRSTLFVVNSEEPKQPALAVPSTKQGQSQSGHSDEARSLYARAG